MATSDLRLKLRLERTLRASVRAIFAALASRLRAGLSKGGVGLVIDVRSVAEEATRGVLRTHYGRVADAFAGRVARGLPADLAMDDEERAEVEARLSTIFDARAREQAERVLATAQRDVHRAVRVAREHVDASDHLDLSAVPALAASIFQARALARARSVATFETQAAAETSKAVEAMVLSGLGARVGTKRLTVEQLQGPAEPEKVWNSQGDSRVRPAHLEADGQRRRLSELYEVGGERLIHPGDLTHGASLDNVIGCRCSSVVDVPAIADLRRFFADVGLRPDRRVIKPTESTVVVTLPVE